MPYLAAVGALLLLGAPVGEIRARAGRTIFACAGGGHGRPPAHIYG
jgi:hypothetical protein